MAWLSFQGWLQLWEIFVLSALFGTVEAFFYPASAALLPELVQAEMLPSANSLSSISGQGAQFVGPAIGAVIIALSGTGLAFALDGLSFLISVLCLMALPAVTSLPDASEKEAGIVQDIREGFRTVLDSPWLRVTLVIASVSTIFLVGPSEAALPLLVKDRFADQVGLYALFTTLSALGSIVAAFWLGHYKRLRRRGLLTYGTWMLASVMLVMVGLPIGVVGVSVAFFVQGAALTALGLAWMNTLQEFVASDVLGRVVSIDVLVSTGLLPIGYGLAGIAADRIGVALVFVAGGTIAALVIAVGLLHPAIRAVD